MPAPSARHIASSALCAALLVGITGPAAVAADSAREHSPAASADTRPVRADVLLAKVRTINGGELAPVADLLDAVLKADNGRLPPDETRKLGDAAKRALADASDPDEVTDALDDAEDVLDDTEGVLDDAEDVLDDVEEGVDSLLEALTSGADDTLEEAGDLLTSLESLVKALLGIGANETILPDAAVPSDAAASSTQTSTVLPSAPPVTLPVITPLLQRLTSIL
ncbi:hypothetical protein ACFYYD_31085 [Streptomyces bluensis]|uniref:hypothetical protein n=1 Tax=Streptomyces bluensis TaxID=33897 RepID=UPI0036CE2F40